MTAFEKTDISCIFNVRTARAAVKDKSPGAQHRQGEKYVDV